MSFIKLLSFTIITLLTNSTSTSFNGSDTKEVYRNTTSGNEYALNTETLNLIAVAHADSVPLWELRLDSCCSAGGSCCSSCP